MKSKNTIISGAIYLGIGTFIAKALGAIYRIPLTNAIGAMGLGLYQMVFPIYSLLLDFSGAGLPSALSRLISNADKLKEERAKNLLINSVKLFFIFGLIATMFMAVFSKPLARLQGDENARFAYLSLSPAILLVSMISCFRGYFQGFMDMKPTAISQIIEQIIKLVFGLILVNIFRYNIALSVGGATLAISFSELIALIYLFLTYKRRAKSNNFSFNYVKKSFSKDSKLIIKTTIPITLIGIMIPFSQVVDSFITINLLSKYMDNATSLYGLLSGVVMTIINLPVSICYGFATVAIPAVSSSNQEEIKLKRSKKVLLLTIIVAIPSALFLLFFAPLSIKLLFRNLSIKEMQIATMLLKISSPIVILLSVVQASNAILIGKGKLYLPIISMFFGITIKTILNLILLKVKKINIYGGAISIIACYFVICLINLIVIFVKKVKDESERNKNRQTQYIE